MQRNGRVARLGQISDVTAYYLIIQGTHEQRREMALHQRFNELGITDEQLRLRILGEFSEETEEQIYGAVERDELNIVDGILQAAKQQNDDMEKKLKELQRELYPISVIDRKTLEKRLKLWSELGLPPEGGVPNLKFNEHEWQRPIFTVGGQTRLEPSKITVASILSEDRRKKPMHQLIFDPEFNLFGGGGYKLAGLRPWVKQTRQLKDKDAPEIWKHRPLSQDADPIGDLMEKLARQRYADFTIAEGAELHRSISELQTARYLFFATHPLLEVEVHEHAHEASYLTFYAFDDSLAAIQEHGFSATSVHTVISILEQQSKMLPQEFWSAAIDQNIESARNAGCQLLKWLDQKKILPTPLNNRYFLPIPVALVLLI